MFGGKKKKLFRIKVKNLLKSPHFTVSDSVLEIVYTLICIYFFYTFSADFAPKKNLVVERRKFFWRNQQDDETFDQYMTELKNLASTCEFGELHDGLLTYKIVDGIRSEKVRDVLLRKGAEMTLAKAINICRTDEITKLQMKEMSVDREVNVIKKKYGKTSRHKNQGGANQMSKSEIWYKSKQQWEEMQVLWTDS